MDEHAGERDGKRGDEHAVVRDRKRRAARREKTMRGNRSVFTIMEAIVQRGQAARRDRRRPDDDGDAGDDVRGERRPGP